MRALAEKAAEKGVEPRLVAMAHRIADKMEGKPRDDADLTARRRRANRVQADFATV
jgi:hypothetical protein